MLALMLSRELRARLVCVAGAAAAVVFLVTTIGEPLRTNWGDPWSDANVQTSGKFFARDGFVRLAFTPTIDIDPLGPQPLRYTHYPPLPDLVNGFQQWLFGPRDISFYRVFALALSFGALFFFFRFVRNVWGPATARFALPLFAFNALFLQYADTVHHVPIYWCSGWGALYAASHWMKNGGYRSLLLAGVSVLVCLFASYDYIFFVPLMTLVTIYVMGSSWRGQRSVRLLAAVAGAATLAIVLKTLLVIWAVGPLEFWNDFVFQFHERATAQHSAEYKDGFIPILLGRVWRFFGPLVYVAIVAQIVGAVDRLRGQKSLVPPSPLLVLFAGSAFIGVFSQLFCEQYHPTLALLPFFAIGVGSVVREIWERERIRWAEPVAMALMFAVYGWQVRELLRFKKTFLERADIALVQKALADDSRNIVLTNALVDAPFRYYWNRYPVGVSADHVILDLRNLFDRYGSDKPFMFIETDGIADTAFDKVLWGIFAPERQWGWISNPYQGSDAWRTRLQKDDSLRRQQLRQFAVPVAASERLRVMKIGVEELDRYQVSQLPEGDTRFIDFETSSADVYKSWGWGRQEKYGIDHGFAWMNEHRHQRMIFTLKGLKELPDGEMLRSATLMVRLSEDKDWRVTARGFSQVSGNSLSLRVNGHESLGTIDADSPNGPREYSFVIPRAHLRAAGIQRLEYSFSAATSDWHHGIAFEWLRADPL